MIHVRGSHPVVPEKTAQSASSLLFDLVRWDCLSAWQEPDDETQQQKGAHPSLSKKGQNFHQIILPAAAASRLWGEVLMPSCITVARQAKRGFADSLFSTIVASQRHQGA
jgi:hypothetical protein